MVEPWWTGVAEIAITGFASILSGIALIMLPMLREWLASKTALGNVLKDQALADKMDDGARNIIRAVEERLKAGLPGRTISPELITEAAKPILEKEFSETLDHFNKSSDAVDSYIRARVPRVEEPAPTPVVVVQQGGSNVPPAVARYRENIVR